MDGRAGLRARLVAVGWCAAFAAWSTVIVARIPVLSGLRLVCGGMLDGELALALQWHWSNWLAGRAIAWNTPDFFYPVHGGLGYNDGFLINGVILAAWRALGADAFAAMQFTDWTMRAAGFAGVWLLARRRFGWTPAFAGLAAALFVTAPTYYVHQSVHAQFLAVNLIPCVVLLTLAAIDAAAARRWRRFLAAAAADALLAGAMLLTSFYTGYFTLLVGGVLLLAMWISIGRPGRAELPATLPFAAAALALLIVAVLPFLALYLPTARETGMHDAGEVAAYAVRPWDVVNTGTHDLIWGRLIDGVTRAMPGNAIGSGEQQMGATPALFLLFLAAPVAWWRDRRTPGGRVVLAAWCAVLLVLAVIVRVPHHAWPWMLLYRFVPGTAGLRVVSRCLLVLLLPMTLLAVAVLCRAWAARSHRAVVALAAVLLVEQVSGQRVFNIDRVAERRFFAGIPSPPAGCRSFAALNARRGPDIGGFYRHNVDAMLVAERDALPTVNGFATFSPTGWALLKPGEADYRERVGAWVRREGVSPPPCWLDFTAPAWRSGGD